MAAATNWTAGQQQGLIPANWTVTDGNITGIACDKSAGATTSYYECADRLGHNRGVCRTEPDLFNGTTVCACWAFGGWDYSCAEARCTYGTVSGCATRIPTHYYLNAVCLSLSMLVVTLTLVYAFSTVWKGRKAQPERHQHHARVGCPRCTQSLGVVCLLFHCQHRALQPGTRGGSHSCVWADTRVHVADPLFPRHTF